MSIRRLLGFRVLPIALFALAVLTAPVLAQESAPPKSSAGGSGIDPVREGVVNKLASMKTSLDFTEAELTDVIDFLQQLTQINFVIDRRVYENARPEDLKVTIQLKEVPLRTALRVILNQRGLTAEYKDGVLLILPKSALEEQIYLRMYDVRDLMFKIKDFPGPEITLQTGESDTVSAAFETETTEKFEDPNFIVDIVKGNTGGDTWDRIQGVSISMAANGILLVTQSREVHNEILKLINLMRLYK